MASRYLPREKIIIIIIFAASFLLRVSTLDSGIYGDEAYYYYLSMFPGKYSVLHRNHPPLLYLLYHPFAASVTTFRLVNILVGSLVPVIIYLILRTYKIREEYQILGASIIIFQPLFVKYSTIVFLDMLSVFFIMLGYLFYRKKQFLLCGLSLGLSCLVKEYALLAAGILIAGSLIRYRSIRKTLLCASGTIAASIVIYIVMFPLGGIVELTSSVAHTPIPIGVDILFIYFSLPFLLILLRHGHYEEFLIPVAYMLFLIIFMVASEWYPILPFAFLAISLMLAFDYIYTNASLLKWADVRLNRTRVFALIYLLLLVTVNLSVTGGFIETNHSHVLPNAAQFVNDHYSGRNLTLIDCFWAYSLYPFGIKLNVIHNDYTGYNHPVLYYRNIINETRLAVIDKENSGNFTIKRELLQFYKDYAVLNNSEYVVIDVK